MSYPADMGYREDEKRWKLIQDMLAAEAGGKTMRPMVSQRTLFGIPSSVDEAIARIVAEDEEARRAARRRKQNPETPDDSDDSEHGADGEAAMEPPCAPSLDELRGPAQEEASRAGLELFWTDEGLTLSDGSMTVRGDFSRMMKRLKPGNLNRELLVRASKLKAPANPPIAVDATAGLGEDALLLAAAGFSVLMFEHNPVMAALLLDALERGRELTDLAEPLVRMKLVGTDSIAGLPQLEEEPDLVLLDPMFPEKGKAAAAKKKLQLLQRLERPCEDESALLEAAIASGARKVIVKRPVKGPHLAARRPDYTLAGKAIRFDCYVPTKPRTHESSA